MTPDGFVERVRAELRALADPGRAPQMQAYMKSAMPYYGVPVPVVRSTVRRLLRHSPETTASWRQWQSVIRRLFDEASHREERYAALAVAGGRAGAPYQTLASLPLYEHLLVEGGWWDIADEVSHRVGDVLLAERPATTAIVRGWSGADDLWLRRCSIICQLGHQEATDVELLVFDIEANLEDPRFFIRKAIGWALREYAKSDPAWVLEFVESRQHRMSGLSRREALKHLPPPPDHPRLIHRGDLPRRERHMLNASTTRRSRSPAVSTSLSTTEAARMPAVYLSHGAPPLADDRRWTRELSDWSAELPRPRAILVISAHWEEAPLSIGATTPVPLVYDFWGFPEHYYQVTYDAPGAPELAAQVRKLLAVPGIGTHDAPHRGLDHGAYVPLVEMYPAADIPTLQISMPTLDPLRLFEIGRRLAPLRDEGVLIMGSGFTTHNLSLISMAAPTDAPPPAWSAEFDAWVEDALATWDLDAVLDFTHKGPAARIAHPRTEHFAPLFVTLGATVGGEQASLAADRSPATSTIAGFWYGLSKRSWQFA